MVFLPISISSLSDSTQNTFNFSPVCVVGEGGSYKQKCKASREKDSVLVQS